MLALPLIITPRIVVLRVALTVVEHPLPIATSRDMGLHTFSSVFSFDLPTMVPIVLKQFLTPPLRLLRRWISLRFPRSLCRPLLTVSPMSLVPPLWPLNCRAQLLTVPPMEITLLRTLPSDVLVLVPCPKSVLQLLPCAFTDLLTVETSDSTLLTEEPVALVAIW